MGTSNKQALERVITAMTSGDLPGMAAGLTDDFTLNVPGTNQLSGSYKGKDEVLNTLIGEKIMGLTGGQFELTPHDLIGSDDHAIGVYNIKATRDGKTIEFRQVNVYHCRDGKLAEGFVNIHDYEAWNAFWS